MTMSAKHNAIHGKHAAVGGGFYAAMQRLLQLVTGLTRVVAHHVIQSSAGV